MISPTIISAVNRTKLTIAFGSPLSAKYTSIEPPLVLTAASNKRQRSTTKCAVMLRKRMIEVQNMTMLTFKPLRPLITCRYVEHTKSIK